MKYDEKNDEKQTVCNLRLGAFGPSNNQMNGLPPLEAESSSYYN